MRGKHTAVRPASPRMVRQGNAKGRVEGCVAIPVKWRQMAAPEAFSEVRCRTGRVPWPVLR